MAWLGRRKPFRESPVLINSGSCGGLLLFRRPPEMRWSTVLPGITVVGAVEEATTEGPTMTSANIDRMPLPALMIGCLFAATLAIGANTVAYPAIAGAERVWDVEDYDNCMDDQSG